MIKIGTILVAKDECLMEDGSGNALIVGKEYKINDMRDSDFMINSEIDTHHFDLDENHSGYWGNFFDLKQIKNELDSIVDQRNDLIEQLNDVLKLNDSITEKKSLELLHNIFKINSHLRFRAYLDFSDPE